MRLPGRSRKGRPSPHMRLVGDAACRVEGTARARGVVRERAFDKFGARLVGRNTAFQSFAERTCKICICMSTRLPLRLQSTVHLHVHTPTVTPTETRSSKHKTQRRQPVSLTAERPRTIYARVTLLAFAYICAARVHAKMGGGILEACARNSLCIVPELISLRCSSLPGRPPVQTRQMMVQGS